MIMMVVTLYQLSHARSLAALGSSSSFLTPELEAM
jgi:hypothetical protein